MTNPEQLKLHKIVSYIKSGLRIYASTAGCIAVLKGRFDIRLLAFLFFGLAEFLGIIEEMVVE